MANFEFVLLIEQVGDELELSLDSENPAGTQRNRRGANGGGGPRKQRIRNERASRHLPSHRHADLIGPHLPLILVDRAADTDTVVWKCARPFVVDVERDDGFSIPNGANPPRSPFTNIDSGQNFSVMPQASVAGAGPLAGFQVVRATFDKGTGAPDHIFYKSTVWSNGLKLDPDLFCDR